MADKLYLRLEPYNPDARDADGDGIVQERTAWERPAGTRILNELGKEIERGVISAVRNDRHSVVDGNGSRVDYIPTYAKQANIQTDRPKLPMEKRGVPTIGRSGVESIGEILNRRDALQRTTLRDDPYDPDARDLVGNGLLQPGTAWERPVGSRILDKDGKEILAGRRSQLRESHWQTVDGSGRGMKYVPTYGSTADLDISDKRSPLERMGIRSISQMGLPTVGDMTMPTTRQRTEAPSVQPIVTVPESPGSLTEKAIVEAVTKPKYPRTPPAHAMTGLAEEKFGKATTWEEFREILKDTDIVFLDYETTGIVFDEFGRASSNGRPTQIGAVRMRDGKVIERFNVFVNPGIPMSDWEEWSRSNLTDGDGNPLSDAFFIDKPSIEEAHRQLLDFIGPDTILGMQNAVFDDAVLADALRSSGIDWKPAGIIDTKEMSSMVLPRWTPDSPDGPTRLDSRTGELVPSNGLADITRYLGVDLGDKHHSADYDAEATGHVLTRIVDGAVDKGWSRDFLDKTKRDEKISSNEDRFAKDIAQFEADKAAYLAFISEPQLDDAIPEVTVEPPVIETADDAIREFLRQVESGELPYPLDENEIAEEIFRLREEFSADNISDKASAETDRILSERQTLSDTQRTSIPEVKAVLDDALSNRGFFDEDYFVGDVDADLAETALEEGIDLSKGEEFALSLMHLFDGEIFTRDGQRIFIVPSSTNTIRKTDLGHTPDGKRRGYFIVRGQLENEDGQIVGFFSRVIYIDREGRPDQKLVVEHSSLNIKGGYQNTGIGTAFNSQMEDVYRQLGVSEIQTSASSGTEMISLAEGTQSGNVTHVGATHWARNGFTWRRRLDRDDFLEILDPIVQFDDKGNPTPGSAVYIEGISPGDAPSKKAMQDIAYFASIDEWNDFVERLRRAKKESFGDPDGILPGDLVRWRGADDYFAGRQAAFEMIRQLTLGDNS